MTRGGLFTLGEGLLRYSVAPGGRFETAEQLTVSEGGAESNVAYAVALMGHRATWFSALPDNPLGHRYATNLSCSGVDVSTVAWMDTGRMGIYYVERGSAPRTGRVIYDRAGSTASRLTSEDVPWDNARSADVIHLTGISPALSDSLAETVSELIRVAQAESMFVTFDLNYRSQLWAGRDAASVLTPMARSSNLVVLGHEDARSVFGLDGAPEELLVALHDRIGAPSIILTLGDQGSIWTIDGAQGRTPALPVSVVDPIGAGDAFAAGLIVGLLGEEKKPDVELGTAMAAMTMTWVGDRFQGDRPLLDRLLATGFTQLDR